PPFPLSIRWRGGTGGEVEAHRRPLSLPPLHPLRRRDSAASRMERGNGGEASQLLHGTARPTVAMSSFYFVGWNLFRLIFSVYCRSRVFNPERVPLTGPVILASNHASFLDPFLVGSSVPREINYLARDDLFTVPVLGWVLRRWHSVPVNREGGGAKGLRAILDRLLDGGA